MNSIARSAFKGPILFLGSGTYLGYIPLASGTFGTLWGLPIYYCLSALSIRDQIFIVFGSICLAIFIAGSAEKILGVKDPSQVVIDEITGYMTAMIGISFSWTGAILGFFIFRILDILKPYPIRKIDQNLPGGWGIVLDDVLAGVYTQIILRIVVYLWE